jgi:ABC-type transport system involved in multi-copper enzyme maturation permease subunit
MNASAALYAIRWLIRDTFRQAWSSGILGIMLGVSFSCILVCLSVSVTGDAPLYADRESALEALPRSELASAARVSASLVVGGVGQSAGNWPTPQALSSDEYRQVANAVKDGVPIVQGNLEMAFGAIRIPIERDRLRAVKTLEVQLAGWVADSAGLLLALLWTAGFLPTFLEPGAVAVLLAKPAPRWSLLAGKFCGVQAFVASQALVFIGGTWLALGLRTGVWDPTYFLCVPVLLMHFAVFFSFSAMLAVATRSTVACVFGSVVFWLLCWAMNFGRHSALLIPELREMSVFFAGTVEAGYWILPKPLDFHIILLDVLHADNLFAKTVDTPALMRQGAWLPGWSVLASVMCAIALLAVAAYDFVTTDY